MHYDNEDNIIISKLRYRIVSLKDRELNFESRPTIDIMPI